MSAFEAPTFVKPKGKTLKWKNMFMFWNAVVTKWSVCHNFSEGFNNKPTSMSEFQLESKEYVDDLEFFLSIF